MTVKNTARPTAIAGWFNDQIERKTYKGMRRRKLQGRVQMSELF